MEIDLRDLYPFDAAGVDFFFFFFNRRNNFSWIIKIKNLLLVGILMCMKGFASDFLCLYIVIACFYGLMLIFISLKVLDSVSHMRIYNQIKIQCHVVMQCVSLINAIAILFHLYFIFIFFNRGKCENM